MFLFFSCYFLIFYNLSFTSSYFILFIVGIVVGSGTWQLAVPVAQQYKVFVVAGDPSNFGAQGKKYDFFFIFSY